MSLPKDTDTPQRSQQLLTIRYRYPATFKSALPMIQPDNASGDQLAFCTTTNRGFTIHRAANANFGGLQLWPSRRAPPTPARPRRARHLRPRGPRHAPYARPRPAATLKYVSQRAQTTNTVLWMFAIFTRMYTLFSQDPKILENNSYILHARKHINILEGTPSNFKICMRVCRKKSFFNVEPKIH